jgi:hypothetical protein
MSQPHPMRPLGKPLLHDPLTCGLGEGFCLGCAADPPDPTAPPWGESLVRDYRQILDQWADLDRQDRPGLRRDQRERLAADKLDTFDRGTAVRARAVNELVTILRWAGEDAPAALAAAVQTAVRELIGASWTPWRGPSCDWKSG